jgi:ferrous iron transport protein B
MPSAEAPWATAPFFLIPYEPFEMTAKQLTVALTGNPNSGKTTIFNNLTGTRQKVGNWPGVTVEKKEGRIQKFGYDLNIIDLPGTYSLTPFSIEEIVARNYILDEHPDVVVDIIDASNLERSLYLATQLRELDCKVLFVLNMADLARSRGIKIDAAKLSSLLDVPVVFTVGNKNSGMDELLQKAIALAQEGAPSSPQRRVKYSKDIEACIRELQSLIEGAAARKWGHNPRWVAAKLLEDDAIVKERILAVAGGRGPAILAKTADFRRQLTDRFDDDPSIVMTDERYGFIAGIIKEAVTVSYRQRVDVSRNIDLVLTNRFLGFPIFIFFIWAMFQLTFSLGAHPQGWIENAVQWSAGWLTHHLSDGLIKDLLVNGILAGVGSVVVFLPNILILFFCIALFEDTGYMARAAFIMDKIMHLIGLHGKSFIPMLMGFGCNVPAIMAARTLESEKDRIATILITPFMSCSAKLPVYLVLAGSFFGERAGSVIFGIYLFGIVVSVVSGRLFHATLFKGADAPFVMELPPYRAPMIKSLLIHMWDRSKLFLRKMTGIILAGSILVWFLSTFPRADIRENPGTEPALEQMQASPAAAADSPRLPTLVQKTDPTPQRATAVEQSWMGRLGKVLAPVFEPIGIDWRGGVALVTGFVAKEIVISTMAVLHTIDDSHKPDALQQALKAGGMTSLSALSMMVFVLLYLPCLATVTMIRKETASWKWTGFSIFYSTAVAWFSAFLVYQGGRALGLNG